jgi:hypothetical protein
VGIKLESLTISQDEIMLAGSLPTVTELQTLIKSINNSDKITGLDITSLTKEGNIIEFTATALIIRSGF